MLNLVTPNPITREEFQLTLDQIAKEGARRMLVEALQTEVSDYLSKFSDLRDDNGKRLVVKNGKAQPRNITLGSGTVCIQAPRVNDRRSGEKFTSQILPPYMRKSPKVENLLPILYLKGLSSSDFKSALTEILGEGVSGLSASSITSLKKCWEKDFEKWSNRLITNRYVYMFADGINLSIRLGEDKKLCLLVIIGVAENGEKHLLSVQSGYRESKDSWKALLDSLTARGLKAPMLAVGDGALGFWAALGEASGYTATKEQRCWVHKIANVLDKLPKRTQPRAKGMLHEMMKSESKRDALQIRKKFTQEFQSKFPKATECLVKDWEELTAFFSFPATHWVHIRTTNAIESTFATVRLRTNVTKGAGSAKAAETMAFKLLEDAGKTWRRIKGYEEIESVLKGIEFKDGVMVSLQKNQEVTAA